MKCINKFASKTLNLLTEGLQPGDSRKIENSGGAYMAVHVNCLRPNHYSVAHYFEQNGDQCPDPDMEFYRSPETKAWLPVNATLVLGYTEAITFKANGEMDSYKPKTYNSLCDFANTWMKNIRFQQDLKI